MDRLRLPLLSLRVFCHAKMTRVCVFRLLLCTHFVKIIFRVLWVLSQSQPLLPSSLTLDSLFRKLLIAGSSVDFLAQRKMRGDYNVFKVLYITYSARAFYLAC